MKTTLQVFNVRVNKSCSFMDFMILLNRKLAEKGYHNVFIYPSLQSEHIRQKLKEFGGEVIIIDGKWDKFSFIKQLFQLIRENNPSVIDFHFVTSISLVPFLVFIRIFKKNIDLVFHYHGEICSLESLSFITKHFSRLRLLTLFFNNIVTVSNANRQFLKTLNIKKKIEVIYNGINLELFNNQDISLCRKELNISKNDFMLTSISSLIPRKGFDVLLNAVSKVVKVIPNIKLVIVGSGPLELMCRQLVRELKIENNVLFLGFVENFPYHILAASDVYVSASNAESFGIVYAESMAYGIPVVATNVGGIPEVVENEKTGLLVPPGNADNLADAIINLLRNKELRTTMGQNGRKRVERLFNLGDRVEELIEKKYQ